MKIVKKQLAFITSLLHVEYYVQLPINIYRLANLYLVFFGNHKKLWSECGNQNRIPKKKSDQWNTNRCVNTGYEDYMKKNLLNIVHCQ
jgi:hypothetical protein